MANEEEKTLPAQFLNNLAVLKEEIRSLSKTNPINVTSKIEALQGQWEKNTQVEEVLSSLLQASQEKKSQVVLNQIYQIEAENLKREEELQRKRQEERDKLIDKIFSESDGVYQKSFAYHEKVMSNLDKILEANTNNKELDEETKKEMRTTPKEIEEAKRREEKQQEAHKLALREIELQKEKSVKIEEEKKQKAHLAENHPERVELREREQRLQERKDLAHNVVKNHHKHDENKLKEAKKVMHVLKGSQEKGLNLDVAQHRLEAFQEIHGVHPEEHIKKAEQKQKENLEKIPNRVEKSSKIEYSSTVIQSPPPSPNNKSKNAGRGQNGRWK